MKKKIISLLLPMIIMTSIFFTGSTNACTVQNVQIYDWGVYHQVVLDFSGKTHREIGEEYGEKILQVVPNYESLMDSYLAGIFDEAGTFEFIMQRVNDIKPQIDADYRDEIEGISSVLSAPNQDVMGDGKVSTNELYVINLLPDVLRATQCSALAVYGERSSTGKTMAARILDWYSGSQNQLAYLQAVTTYKNGSKSICTIGYLGYVGVLTGFNDNKVFAGILDSTTGGFYTSQSKRSYTLDLRNALENCSTLDEVADFMKSPTREYAYSHLIYLCDPNTSKVLENNITTGPNCIRDIRTESSALNTSIEWGISNSIGCVNSFVLNGNVDNHTTQSINPARWNAMKTQLLSKGSKVTLDELKQVAGYHSGILPGYMDNGDLYNVGTQQIVIFEPDNFHLQIFFRPKLLTLPLPIYITILVLF